MCIRDRHVTQCYTQCCTMLQCYNTWLITKSKLCPRGSTVEETLLLLDSFACVLPLQSTGIPRHCCPAWGLLSNMDIVAAGASGEGSWHRWFYTLKKVYLYLYCWRFAYIQPSFSNFLPGIWVDQQLVNTTASRLSGVWSGICNKTIWNPIYQYHSASAQALQPWLAIFLKSFPNVGIPTGEKF